MNNKAVRQVMRTLADRPHAKLERRCVIAPVGCGKPITKFNDELSEKEYGISGLCQACQDRIFKEEV